MDSKNGTYPRLRLQRQNRQPRKAKHLSRHLLVVERIQGGLGALPPDMSFQVRPLGVLGTYFS